MQHVWLVMRRPPENRLFVKAELSVPCYRYVLPRVHRSAEPAVTRPGQDPGIDRWANPDHRETASGVPGVHQLLPALY